MMVSELTRSFILPSIQFDQRQKAISMWRAPVPISGWKLILLSAFLCLGMSPAFAAPINSFTITPTVSGPAGGIFTYMFTLTADGPDSIAAFQLSGPSMDIIAGSTLGPAGWDIFEAGNLVSWLSLDSTSDIFPNTSLGGFSFQSFNSPGVVSATLFFIDENTGLITESLDSTTTGPVGAQAVPEPGVGWTFIGSILVWAAAARGGRAKNRSGGSEIP